MKRKNYLLKTFIGVGLSFSIFLSGSFGTLPDAYASAHTSVQKNSVADRIIATGERYLGIPYRLGAPAGSTNVFDCSSFTQYVFKQNGITIPRSSRQQVNVGTFVPKGQWQVGDLLFFSTRASGPGKVGHVGIYAGNGKILHTFGNPRGVTYDNLNTAWLKQGYITARRVIPNQTNVLPPSNPTSGSVQSPSNGQAISFSSQALKETATMNALLSKYGYKTHSDAQRWYLDGETVSTDQLKKGDLLFLSTTGSRSSINHVGVYIGSGKLMHIRNQKRSYYRISSKIIQNSLVVAKRAK